MEYSEAIKILRRHNRWRRGAYIEMDNPKIIGIAIDTVLSDYKDRRDMLNWANSELKAKPKMGRIENPLMVKFLKKIVKWLED